jgi:hypothetical protein
MKGFGRGKLPDPDLVTMAAHLMQQEARLRLQGDLLATLAGQMAGAAGGQRDKILDLLQEAGLRSSDQEEQRGSSVDRANAIAMRDDLKRIIEQAALIARDGDPP